MDRIFYYIVDMPNKTREMVTPCQDGYTVYINENLSPEGRKEAFRHALWHIRNNDFEKENVQDIEAKAHERRKT